MAEENYPHLKNRLILFAVFLGAFAKLRNVAVSSSCQSVGPSKFVQLCSYWTDFHENL